MPPACGGRPLTTRTDFDSGWARPSARSALHCDQAQSAGKAPPHQPSCFALQVCGSSFRQYLAVKAAPPVVVDDALRAEYRVLRRGALGAPAVWSDMLWTSVEGRKVPMDRVDGGRQQPADICVCSRVLLRCRLRAA